jgi:Fe-S-cluster-containing dehydrogenase component
MKWGMVVDPKRCIGCYGCQLSCKAEHGTPPLAGMGGPVSLALAGAG